jgi:sRNA-binding carbon storage regulator CsrA
MEHQHQISVKCVDMFVLTSRIAKTILVYNNVQFYILMTKQVHVKLFVQIPQSNSLLIQLTMIAIQIVKLAMSEIMIQVIVFNRI